MPNMIVTLINSEINIEDGKIFFQNAKLEAQYGKIKKFRTYKINMNNFEYTLMCPEIVTVSSENTVFWPSFKLPYRKYPVYVYIYAAALYLSTNKSMRMVAADVKKKFGLEKFSHSTVSRCLKKLLENLEILIRLIKPDKTAIDLIKRTHWSNEKMINYSILLSIINPILNNKALNSFGSTLNFKFFNQTNKFPL